MLMAIPSKAGIIDFMKVKIQIDTQTFVRFWLVVIGFAAAGWLLFTAREALTIIGVSFFLAIALSKPVATLAKMLPNRSRVGGTAIAFVLIVVALGIFGFLVVPPIIEQTAKIASTVPSLVENAQNQWHGLSGLVQRYHLEPQVNQAAESVRSSVVTIAQGAGGMLVSGIGSAASLLTASLLVLVLTFLMLVEGPVWVDRIWLLYTNRSRMLYHRGLLDKMYNVVTNYVNGQLLISMIGGLNAGLAVFILSLFTGIPANLAMPVIALTFVLSLIPMFGATIAGALATALLALNDLTAAVIYVIFFIVYQQLENNLIAPVVQSRSINLSALVILTAVTIGTYMFGIAGGIISIPIAGCIKILLEDYVARRRSAQAKTKLKKAIAKVAGSESAAATEGPTPAGEVEHEARSDQKVKAASGKKKHKKHRDGASS